jgi:hypothetical protein
MWFYKMLGRTFGKVIKVNKDIVRIFYTCDEDGRVASDTPTTK